MSLNKALELAGVGYYVFPCREHDEWVGERLYESKSPYTPRGFHDASVDAETITQWWTQWPDALVGVAAGLSGLVILDLDVDPIKNLDGVKAVADAGLSIPETVYYETRRGGIHHVYKAPEGPELAPRKNYVEPDGGTVLEGVDRRSGGSYAIWWGDAPDMFDTVADCPEWFAANTPQIDGSPYEGTVDDWARLIPQGDMSPRVLDAVKRIPADDFGHDELIKQQAHLVKLAVEGNAGVVEALENLRNEWLRGEYNTPEYAREFEVGLAGAVAKYGGQTEEEREFWTRRPILEHTFDASRKLMASPWALLGGAMLRAIHTVPFQVQYRSQFGPGSINMINVFVGDSGGGKSLLQAQLNEVYDFPIGFVAHEVGSGEALSEQFVRTVNKDTGEPEEWGNPFHAEMFSFDEVGRLNAMNQRNGGSTVLEYMKTGWSGGRLGRRLVGGKGVEIPAHTYRMTAFLNAQPERADMLLSDDEIEGGFPGRVMWVSLQDSSVVREYRPGAVKPFKIAKQSWGKVDTIHALPQMNEAHVNDRISFHTGNRDKLDGHELMLKVRVAIALMVLDGRQVLNDEDWELAEVALNHSRTTRKMVQQKIADRAMRDAVASGKAAGRREAISKTETDDVLYAKALAQAESAIEKMKDAGDNPTKGRVKSKMTRSLQTYIDDVWEELGL